LQPLSLFQKALHGKCSLRSLHKPSEAHVYFLLQFQKNHTNTEPRYLPILLQHRSILQWRSTM
jgi:hypothetical protein